MPAANHDITIEQGATFTEQWEWQDSAAVPVNLTGYTAKLQIRALPDAASPALVTLTDTAGITLGGATGIITPTITAAVTLTLPIVSALRYDLRMTAPSGKVTRLVKGSASVDPAVTL